GLSRVLPLSRSRGRPVDVPVPGVGAGAAHRDVLGLDRRDLVTSNFTLGGAYVELVEPRGVAAEDRGLDEPIGGTERGETVLLLHVIGDLQTAQRLDLPLGRPVPHRVAAPDDVVGAHPLTSVPMNAAAKRGFATAELANAV